MISYAMDCASYLFANVDNIDSIILHGSIARGDYDKKSDIDLFIDTTDKKIQIKAEKVLANYYRTQTYKNWNLKSINNPISLIVDNLDSDEWKNLKRAIINTGIILYGKYKANTEKVNCYTLFSFSNIKPNKKRVSVYRKIFGFSINKKEYKGLVKEWNAVKISSGSLLIPIEKVKDAKRFFSQNKVTVKLYDFWSDTKII